MNLCFCFYCNEDGNFRIQSCVDRVRTGFTVIAVRFRTGVTEGGEAGHRSMLYWNVSVTLCVEIDHTGRKYALGCCLV